MSEPTELKSYSQRLSQQLHGQDEASDQRSQHQRQQLLNAGEMITDTDPDSLPSTSTSGTPTAAGISSMMMMMESGLDRPRSMTAELPANDRSYSPTRSGRSSDANTPTSAQWTSTSLVAQHEMSITPLNESQAKRSRENFTPEQLAFLRQLYSNGVTRTSCHLEIQAAANQLNISYDRVKNWINNNNKRIRQLAVKEKKRAAAATAAAETSSSSAISAIPWPIDSRQTGRTTSATSDRMLYPTSSGSGPNFPVNIMSSISETASETSMLMSSNDGGVVQSHNVLLRHQHPHQHPHHADNPDEATSFASPFSSRLKRARTDLSERLVPSRPSSQYACEDIDLLVMNKEDVVGAFPVPNHATLMHVVQLCIEVFGNVLPQRFAIARTHPQTNKHVLLLASQLNEPVSIHLKHGVLIFLDNTTSEHIPFIPTVSSSTGSTNSIFALLEQMGHGQIRRISNSSNIGGGNTNPTNSPMHYSTISETSLKKQPLPNSGISRHGGGGGSGSYSSQNSLIVVEHSPIDHQHQHHLFDSTRSHGRTSFDNTDMANLMGNHP